MAADALFAKDAQNSIREALQDPQTQDMLNSLLRLRRQLLDHVQQKSSGTALFQSSSSSQDPLVSQVVQRASQQGVTVNPTDVQKWLDQNGAPAA